MYAIIEDRGRQYRAEPGARLVLDRSPAEIGAEVEVPVLLSADGDAVEVGSPYLERAAKLRVLRHFRGEKGIVGTFKRRKDSRRRMGYRHEHTEVEVVGL